MLEQEGNEPRTETVLAVARPEGISKSLYKKMLKKERLDIMWQNKRKLEIETRIEKKRSAEHVRPDTGQLSSNPRCIERRFYASSIYFC